MRQEYHEKLADIDRSYHEKERSLEHEHAKLERDLAEAREDIELYGDEIDEYLEMLVITIAFCESQIKSNQIVYFPELSKLYKVEWEKLYSCF